MDRNPPVDTSSVNVSVALRKESVDRNAEDWLNAGALSRVALRKESVDRNAEDWLNAGALSRSLSARRAWIEMPAKFGTLLPMYRRSPQGERG